MNHHLRWGHLDWCKVISYPDWALGVWNPESDSCRFPRITLAGFDMVQSCLIQPPVIPDSDSDGLNPPKKLQTKSIYTNLGCKRPMIRIGPAHERWDSHHHPNGFVHKWDMHPKNRDPQIHCFMIILVEIAISLGFAPFSDPNELCSSLGICKVSWGVLLGRRTQDDELSHPTSRPRAAPLDFPHKAWTAAYGPLLMCSLPEDRESCNTGGVTIIVRWVCLKIV